MSIDKIQSNNFELNKTTAKKTAMPEKDLLRNQQSAVNNSANYLNNLLNSDAKKISYAGSSYSGYNNFSSMSMFSGLNNFFSQSDFSKLGVNNSSRLFDPSTLSALGLNNLNSNIFSNSATSQKLGLGALPPCAFNNNISAMMNAMGCSSITANSDIAKDFISNLGTPKAFDKTFNNVGITSTSVNSFFGLADNNLLNSIRLLQR